MTQKDFQVSIIRGEAKCNMRNEYLAYPVHFIIIHETTNINHRLIAIIF